jgi:protocatechuate 3,4-dioxygenase beta subunit
VTADRVSPDLVALLREGVTCPVWPEQDEGPYYRDVHRERRNVAEGRPGAVLRLAIRLVQEDELPVRDASVSIWHCDASGRYSGFPPPAAAAPKGQYLAGETFLRGRQRTDPTGAVEFQTIYPGWYPGRTVHVHVVAHNRGHTYISQLYFPEAVTDAVFRQTPYRERRGRDTTNDTDELYSRGGEASLLHVVRDNRRGYAAAVCLGLR